MALPNIMRRLFRNDGYGPLLKAEIIPFASGLDDKSGAAASTEWVKDLADAEVYVDASVSSSGDGFTAATAVKTISEGIAILQSLPLSGEVKTRLHVAAGIYNEDVTVRNLTIDVDLGGSTTINGRVRANFYARVHFNGDSGTVLTINKTGERGILAWEYSSIAFYCPVVVACSNSSRAIEAYFRSQLAFMSTLTLNGSSISDYGILVGAFSNVRFLGNVSVSGVHVGIAVFDHGMLGFDSGIDVTISCNDLAIQAYNESSVIANARNYNISALTAFSSMQESAISISNFSTITFSRTKANGVFLDCFRCSSIALSQPLSSNSLVDVRLSSYSGGNVISSHDASCVILDGAFKMTMNGTCDCTVYLDIFGYIYFSPSINIVSSSINGKKAKVYSLSMLHTQNSGGAQSRFPGSGYEIDSNHYAVSV